MRTWFALPVCALLAACAGPREVAQRPDFLFDDRLFAAPSERVGADEILKVSDTMRRSQIEAQLRRKGLQRGLLEALRTTGELRLDYDARTTRNAAQAFDPRFGGQDRAGAATGRLDRGEQPPPGGLARYGAPSSR